jgi:hypothetical protein
MLANVLAMNKIFSTSFVVNVSKGIFENWSTTVWFLRLATVSLSR